MVTSIYTNVITMSMVREFLKPGDVDEDRFERAKRIDWLDFDSIVKAKILMVGAGAIGNETGKDLVLSGFRDITVVDMDHIVSSNLARCLFFSDRDAEGKEMKARVVAEGMMVLGDDITVRPITSKVQELGEDFVSKFDIVLGCLDNLLARLYLNSHCYKDEVPYIDAAMDKFRGKVQVVLPPESPCLECSMNASHGKIIEQRFSCTGNDISLFVPKIGADITTTSVVAAVQVREAVKIVSGRRDDVLKNVLYYDGVRNTTDVLDIQKREDCPVH